MTVYSLPRRLGYRTYADPPKLWRVCLYLHEQASSHLRVIVDVGVFGRKGIPSLVASFSDHFYHFEALVTWFLCSFR